MGLTSLLKGAGCGNLVAAPNTEEPTAYSLFDDPPPPLIIGKAANLTSTQILDKTATHLGIRRDGREILEKGVVLYRDLYYSYSGLRNRNPLPVLGLLSSVADVGSLCESMRRANLKGSHEMKKWLARYKQNFWYAPKTALNEYLITNPQNSEPVYGRYERRIFGPNEFWTDSSANNNYRAKFSSSWDNVRAWAELPGNQHKYCRFEVAMLRLNSPSAALLLKVRPDILTAISNAYITDEIAKEVFSMAQTGDYSGLDDLLVEDESVHYPYENLPPDYRTSSKAMRDRSKRSDIRYIRTCLGMELKEIQTRDSGT